MVVVLQLWTDSDGRISMASWVFAFLAGGPSTGDALELEIAC